MKNTFLIIISVLAPFYLTAQNIRLNGKVVDDSTGVGISGVHIYMSDDNTTGNTSNNDGDFVLKANNLSPLIFSHVGYKSIIKNISDTETNSVIIRMNKIEGKLKGVTVNGIKLTGDLIMNKVFDHLKENHSTEPVYYNFYNRIVNFQENDSTLNLLEEYTGSIFQNQRSLTKYKFSKARIGAFSKTGRKNIASHRYISADKMMIDNMFKYRENYLKKKKSRHYEYKIIDRVEILGRHCFVISFYTNKSTHYKQGKLFVDMDSYAITKKTLEDENGLVLNETSFTMINNKWFLIKAIDTHQRYNDSTVDIRLTLYNMIFNISDEKKADFINLPPIKVSKFASNFRQDFWKDETFIPLPNWIKRQMKF